MVSVKLYNLSKERNSTKQPTGQPTATISGLFLQGASIDAPSIRFDLNYTTNEEMTTYSEYRECNYAQIVDFSNRYYFIETWTFDGRGFWVASMTVDPLATYKTAIGNSTQYVCRSASQYNENLYDDIYPTTNETLIHKTVSIWPYASNIATGRKFILGINGTLYDRNLQPISYLGERYGGAYYISMNYDAVGYMTDSLYNSDTTINALQYVRTYHILPFDVDLITQGDNNIVYAATGNGGSGSKQLWFEQMTGPHTGENAHLAKSILPTMTSADITLPVHPQASTVGRFLKKSKYTSYILYFPSFGSVEIAANDVFRNDNIAPTIRIEITTDISSGQSMLTILNNSTDRVIIARMYSNIAIPLSIDETGRNLRNIASTVSTGVIGVAGSVAAGAAMAGAPGAIVGGALSIAQNVIGMATSDAFVPQTMTTRGGGGNSLGMQTGIATVIGKFLNVTDTDFPRFGRPLYDSRQISTLSGFIQCQAPHVHTPSMLPNEQDTIETYMNGGFFFE